MTPTLPTTPAPQSATDMLISLFDEHLHTQIDTATADYVQRKLLESGWLLQPWRDAGVPVDWSTARALLLRIYFAADPETMQAIMGQITARAAELGVEDATVLVTLGHELDIEALTAGRLHEMGLLRVKDTVAYLDGLSEAYDAPQPPNLNRRVEPGEALDKAARAIEDGTALSPPQTNP